LSAILRQELRGGLPDAVIDLPQSASVEQARATEIPPSVAPRTVYVTIRSLFDPLIAGFLLIICGPLIAAIWVAIRLSSPGPGLFQQQRIGKGGKPFTIFKFRTMRVEAPTYSLKVADHDPAITRVGRFLRRTGLDELPQLWNVVRGDMALIGPRPEQIDLHALYEPWQRQRHLVKPGITGWWQIHHRDGVPLHLNVDKDLHYIQHQGLWIDCLILICTCRIVLLAVLGGLNLRGTTLLRVAGGDVGRSPVQDGAAVWVED
jgi:lipopolysaccharide/colanic/teichoic acid biosynthesis glycosyltransferase